MLRGPCRLSSSATRRLFLGGTCVAGGAVLVGMLGACGRAGTGTVSTTAIAAASGVATSSTGAALPIVAAENVWGSIAGQLGGDRVRVTSIITNPDTDPHGYEPTPNDARLIATARYVIVNGAGYDPWLPKLLAANPVADRRVLTVSDLVGKKDGDNPHLWYNPDYVGRAMQQITADYKALVPADAAYFDQQYTEVSTVRFKDYHDLVSTIQQRFAGVPVAATESIFVYLAGALRLQLLTPPGFMQAISDGNEPTAAEKATFDQQITQHQIKVLVNNKQNETPDTTVLKQKARDAGIPIVDITETLDPATASFQDWQAAQLQALQQALATATGK
jgi:zinc/manganese transport system substrate-binding protein